MDAHILLDSGITLHEYGLDDKQVEDIYSFCNRSNDFIGVGKTIVKRIDIVSIQFNDKTIAGNK